MAQLKSTVVQGSLRVTDTTYTTDLILSGSKTARYALIAPTSAGAPTWRALTKADINDFPTNLNQFTNGPGYVTSSGVTSITIKTTSPITGGSDTATTSTGTYTIAHASGDGNLHVPATGTGNNGKVLKAGSTAGSLSWGTLSKSDVGLNNVTNDAQVKASLGTAKGDMVYWTASASPARLAIGTAGYTLQATANGPAWTQTVAIANGGTGLTSSPSILTDLASTTAANVLQANPRPGITGTLGVGHGGTGLTSSPSMLINLASTTAADVLSASPRPGITGTLGIGNGGTGATTADAAWTALGGGDSGKHAENYYALAGHTHAANAVIKSTDISWSNVATYTYSDSWITANTAIVATDLQYKKPAAIIEWVVSAGKIVFTCSAACTISFSIMMLKQA